MAQSLQGLLLGFQWISWTSVLLGLIETYGYGWYGVTCPPKTSPVKT